MNSRWRPLILFCLLVALFPAIGSVVRWTQGEILSASDWLGIAAFPALAWIWFRHFSILGCRDACRLPTERDTPKDRAE